MRATATILLGLAAEVAVGVAAAAATPPDVERLVSPNGRIAVAVHTAPRLSYDVFTPSSAPKPPGPQPSR